MNDPWIRLTAQDGHEFDAYRALPEGEARGGIVMIQEIFGVNGHIREVADEYAREGYAVLAPALFDRVRSKVDLGYTPEGTAEGRALRAEIGWDKPILDIEAAAKALRSGTPGASPVGKVATIGFCWGGSLSFLMACRSDVDCAVAYYGGQIIQFVDERPKVPVMMHFGERDALIPEADRDRIRAKHEGHAGSEIHVYAAGHGFNCTARLDYEPLSAGIAKGRTLAFLAKHLV